MTGTSPVKTTQFGSWRSCPGLYSAGTSHVRRDAVLLVAAALHRGGNPHRFAVLRDGAAGNVDARLSELLHDGVVRQDFVGLLSVDQLPDAVTHGFGRMGLTAIRRRDCRREEELHLESAAAG